MTGSNGGAAARAMSILDPARLDNVALRLWSHTGVVEQTGRAFWSRVTAYVEFVESRPELGGFVLVVGHTGPDMMALFLALIACGRLAAFFPPNSPLQDQDSYFRQQRIALERIDPAAICIFAPEMAETIRRIDPGLGSRVVIAPSSDEVARQAVGEPRALAMVRARLASEAPIFVQHSSGTTGIKKAVGISGRALAGQFAAYWPLLEQLTGERPRIASWLPLYHDMGLIAAFLLPILAGDTISIVDPFEWIAKPDLLFEMIERDGANICWMPNFAFRHYCRLRKMLPRRDLSSVKLWIDCSEPCRYAEAIDFEDDFAGFGVRRGSVVGCYAMAETVFAVSQLAPAEQRALATPRSLAPGANLFAAGGRRMDERARATAAGDKLVLSSGRPIPGLEVAVRVDGARAAEGVYGEIAIRGDFLFNGYRGATPGDSVDPEGFFATGDLGAMIDGHLYVFGRLKEIIIVNGKNLFAGDVEDLVNRLPGVKKGRAAAFGVDNERTGSEELVVVAELAQEADASAAETRAAISRVVSESLLVKPVDVRVVEERWLVKSTSGKISRRENRQKYLDTFRPVGKQ